MHVGVERTCTFPSIAGKKTISAGKGMDADAFEGGDGGGGWRADDDFDFM